MIRWCGAVLVLLGGCAGLAGDPATPLRDSLAATQASLRAIRGEAAPPPPLPDARHGATTTPALAAPGPLPPPLPRGSAPVAASALLRRSGTELRAVLGEPALRRAEGVAEIWLYEAPRCRLDVILYREDGAMRVAHAEARAFGTQSQTEADCLADIAARAPRPPGPPRA